MLHAYRFMVQARKDTLANQVDIEKRKFVLRPATSKELIAEAKLWCDEHSVHDWLQLHDTFYFISEDDAALFRLAYG